MRKEILIDKQMDEVVMHYTKNAKMSGLDGVVCYLIEAGKVNNICGEELLTITPGVRFSDSRKIQR